MKKLIFATLAAMLTLAIVSCNDITDPDSELGRLTDVVYSKDGKSVTIYLDGAGVPQTAANRALSRDLAQKGYDFYEVVFTDGDATTPVVTRTSWEIGQPAAVRGVPREIAYPTDAVAASGANAVLFVGKKSDKTLLAVGLLTEGEEDNGDTVVIASDTLTLTAHTVSVTFELAALKASAHDPDPAPASPGDPIPALAEKSFVGGTIDVIPAIGKLLPVHVIYFNPAPAATQAPEKIKYKLETDTTADIIAKYLPGIIVSSAPAETKAELKFPRIAQGGGTYYELPGPYAIDAEVDPSFTATVAGAAFGNDLELEITPVKNTGVVSLLFSIPVNAVTESDSTVDTTVKAVQWYIRHGFGTSLYDLDEGNNNAGGSLLLCIGPIVDYLKIIDGGLIAP